jgi:hypothetical protein
MGCPADLGEEFLESILVWKLVDLDLVCGVVQRVTVSLGPRVFGPDVVL